MGLDDSPNPPKDAAATPTDAAHDPEPRPKLQENQPLPAPHPPLVNSWFSNPPPPPPSGQSPYAVPPPLPHPIYGPPLTNGVPYPHIERTTRKATRASQACDSCRQLKAKCDEAKPSCKTCKDRAIECRYRDPQPKPDRQFGDILDGISNLQRNLDRLVQYLPVVNPSRGRQPSLLSLEDHLGSQDPIAISPAQRQILEELEKAFSRLTEFDNWSVLGPRLAWYVSTLCRNNNADSRPERPDEDDGELATKSLQKPADGTTAQRKGSDPPLSGHQSRDASRERQPLAESEPTAGASLKRKRSPAPLGAEPEKPFFCFHQSCDRSYGSGKTLQNHLRNQHHGKVNLPSTCDHSSTIKRFSTWEECLEHFIFHQKSGMSRIEYDKALENAEHLISHDNQQVDNKVRVNSPAASLMGSPSVSFPYGVPPSDTGGLPPGNSIVWPSPTEEMGFGL